MAKPVAGEPGWTDPRFLEIRKEVAALRKKQSAAKSKPKAKARSKKAE